MLSSPFTHPSSHVFPVSLSVIIAERKGEAIQSPFTPLGGSILERIQGEHNGSVSKGTYCQPWRLEFSFQIPTWWAERTKSLELFSDFLMCAHEHSQINKLITFFLKVLRFSFSILFLYVCICCMHVYLYSMRIQSPQRSEEGIRSSDAGVTTVSHHVGAGNRIWVLWRAVYVPHH